MASFRADAAPLEKRPRSDRSLGFPQRRLARIVLGTARSAVRGIRLLASPWCVFVAWAIGQLARDRTWATGILFYVPSPVVALFLLASSAILAIRRRRARALAALALSIPPLLVVGLVENRFGPPPNARHRASTSSSPSGILRAVHWNVCDGKRGSTKILETLREWRADLYLLSEFPNEIDTERVAASLGDGYHAIRIGSMAAAARGRFTAGRWLLRERSGRIATLRWESPMGPLTILAVDLTSRLEVARGPLLERVRDLMQSERADLVLGDFNAPRRSLALAPLPEGWTHAYSAAGSGWSYTWPVPIPLWSLDQAIIGARIRAIEYELASTPWSDHRLQALDFEIAK